MRNTIPILLLLCSFHLAEAQPHELNFINFSGNDGLSSSTVNSILKDKYGYMWFATEDGLNRFDGSNFVLYNHNALDSTTIGTNQIQTIYEDRKGDLWIGTNRTLSLYDRKKDCFQNYNITSGTAVRSICSDSLGRLWIGSYAGLIRFDPGSGASKTYNKDQKASGRLLSNIVICVFHDSHGRLWVGTNAGLYLYLPATDDFRCFCNNPADPGSLSNNIVRTIVEDVGGNLVVGTVGGGLNVLQPDGRHFSHITTSPSDIHTLSSNQVYSLAVDRSGALWVGTEEGLNILDLHSGKAQRISGNLRNKYGLKGKAVRSIFIDPCGIYWVGTVQGGVNKYDKNLPFFNLVQYNPFDAQGLSSPKVTSFAEGAGGDIYIGTDGGGLNLFHPGTGLCDHLSLGQGDTPRGLAILAMERAGNELWIGTFQQGVYVLNLRTGKTRHYIKGNGPHDLPSGEIFCIKKDNHGGIWLGTNGKGVCRYVPGVDSFSRFSAAKKDDAARILLSGGFIRALEEDGAGRIIIGTVGSGLVLYDPVKDTAHIFNRANTGLPLDEVITLHVDRSGTIWAGTPSGGLCRLDFRDHRLAAYSEQQGLANAVIYKILEDDAGKLWVSTNKGISRFDPANATTKNYSSRNGLQQGAFNLGAGLKRPSGELLFGGIEGFNYFQPARLADNSIVPAIVFTDLRIGGHSVSPANSSAIAGPVSLAREIDVEYKQNFSLDFTALDYTTPGDNRFMYRLDGLDKSWNYLGTSKTAAFTNLYPGDYTLEVRARNCNGAWTTPAASIRIHVKPPFWLTAYAYAFYILMVGLLLWAIRYRGIQKLKNKFALEQERLRMKQMIEQERREADRLHEFDQLKIKFLTNLSHEFRTPVSLILGPIEKLEEQDDNPERQGQLSMVKRNARRLLNLVNQLLDFRKLEEQESKLIPSEGDLIAFLKDISESFRDIAETKQISFAFKTDIPHYHTCFDRDKIERVVFNLLGNAFKFTPRAGSVTLELKPACPDTGIVIIVSDTGIGMPEDERLLVFNRFFQGKIQEDAINQGSGIGLSITREFVQLHGGTITVDSSPGKGSRFTITLPFEPRQASYPLEEPHPASPQSADATAFEIPAADKLTVLLIDDSDDFRSYLRHNLQPFYTIVEAADGKEGWQKTLSCHPDIIVSDITMPGMDGIELSRKIRADKRVSHIPVILLTALTGRTYQLRGLETGASDYLTKPFAFEILNIKIRNLVMLNQRLRETYTRRLSVDTPLSDLQSEDEKLVLRVTRYIESNLDSTQLSVEDLCRHVHMSHASLYRKIVELTGETPVEFIRGVKLNKAAHLLERSDMKIAEIGYAVGFTTPNYFTRAFRAKFNLSPSEYVSLKRKQAS